MPEQRYVRKVTKSRPTIEGAGVHLRRAIGFGTEHECDPFLLLDDFRSDDPAEYDKGFPWHPHRGIETITYVLRGDVEHADSLGNRGVISSGDVQWMTAGSGIIHQEMPKGDERGAMHGFQLWANLPASHKMMQPRYLGIAAAEIPELEGHGGARVRVIAGSVEGVRGPVRDVIIEPLYLDVTVPAGGSFTHETPVGHTVFAYIFGGSGSFGRPETAIGVEGAPGARRGEGRTLRVGDGHLVLFGDGDEVTVSAEPEPVRFLLVAGRPLGEPIAWSGPIVMNTQEDIRVALDELRRGTFIKAGNQGR